MRQANANAEDWQRQIVNAGGDEGLAQRAVALAALNGLFDHYTGRENMVMSVDNDAILRRHREQQLFYGWFEDAGEIEPANDPPLGGPCPLCGKTITLLVSDVRTHSLMYQSPQYAKRSYFYRTHRTCAEKDETHIAADSFILDMIVRNGD